MRETIQNKQFDEERALYNLTGADVTDCVFAGPADGSFLMGKLEYMRFLRF